MSGKFSPKDKKPAFKVIQDEKPVEKINLNFKKKKKEEPAYTLKPNQRAFKVPETKKPEEKEKEPQQIESKPKFEFDQDKYDEENKNIKEAEDTGLADCGFKIGGGKKFGMKMDPSKAASILSKF